MGKVKNYENILEFTVLIIQLICQHHDLQILKVV